MNPQRLSLASLMKGDLTLRAVGARVRRVTALALTTLALAVPATAHAAEAFTSGLFWRISRPGVPDSHVLGTIHVPDPRVNAVPDNVRAALEGSRVLATELVLRVVGDHLPDAEFLDPPQRLDTLLGAARFADLQRALEARDVPADTIWRLKPWAALLRLTESAGTAGASLDDNLYALARARRLPVRTLESADEQLCAFDAIPLDTQVALLVDTLGHPADGSEARERAMRSYLAGDLAALAALPPAARRDPALDPHYRALAKHLIVDRTVVMHHSLFVPLRAGGVFVAVGASHLYGDKGLLALLRADGYRITRLH